MTAEELLDAPVLTMAPSAMPSRPPALLSAEGLLEAADAAFSVDALLDAVPGRMYPQSDLDEIRAAGIDLEKSDVMTFEEYRNRYEGRGMAELFLSAAAGMGTMIKDAASGQRETNRQREALRKSGSQSYWQQFLDAGQLLFGKDLPHVVGGYQGLIDSARLAANKPMAKALAAIGLSSDDDLAARLDFLDREQYRNYLRETKRSTEFDEDVARFAVERGIQPTRTTVTAPDGSSVEVEENPLVAAHRGWSLITDPTFLVPAAGGTKTVASAMRGGLSAGLRTAGLVSSRARRLADRSSAALRALDSPTAILGTMAGGTARKTGEVMAQGASKLGQFTAEHPFGTAAAAGVAGLYAGGVNPLSDNFELLDPFDNFKWRRALTVGVGSYVTARAGGAPLVQQAMKSMIGRGGAIGIAGDVMQGASRYAALPTRETLVDASLNLAQSATGRQVLRWAAERGIPQDALRFALRRGVNTIDNTIEGILIGGALGYAGSGELGGFAEGAGAGAPLAVAGSLVGQGIDGATRLRLERNQNVPLGWGLAVQDSALVTQARQRFADDFFARFTPAEQELVFAHYKPDERAALAGLLTIAQGADARAGGDMGLRFMDRDALATWLIDNEQSPAPLPASWSRDERIAHLRDLPTLPAGLQVIDPDTRRPVLLIRPDAGQGSRTALHELWHGLSSLVGYETGRAIDRKAVAAFERRMDRKHGEGWIIDQLDEGDLAERAQVMGDPLADAQQALFSALFGPDGLYADNALQGRLWDRYHDRLGVPRLARADLDPGKGGVLRWDDMNDTEKAAARRGTIFPELMAEKFANLLEDKRGGLLELLERQSAARWVAADNGLNLVVDGRLNRLLRGLESIGLRFDGLSVSEPVSGSTIFEGPDGTPVRTTGPEAAILAQMLLAKSRMLERLAADPRGPALSEGRVVSFDDLAADPAEAAKWQHSGLIDEEHLLRTRQEAGQDRPAADSQAAASGASAAARDTTVVPDATAAKADGQSDGHADAPATSTAEAANTTDTVGAGGESAKPDATAPDGQRIGDTGADTAANTPAAFGEVRPGTVEQAKAMETRRDQALRTALDRVRVTDSQALQPDPVGSNRRKGAYLTDEQLAAVLAIADPAISDLIKATIEFVNTNLRKMFDPREAAGVAPAPLKVVYYKATGAGRGKKRQYVSVGAQEYLLQPMSLFVAEGGQFLFNALDMGAWERAAVAEFQKPSSSVRDVFGTLDGFRDATLQLLDNYRAGREGATNGVSPQERDSINGFFNWTARDNPLAHPIPSLVPENRGQFLKSFRFDRTHAVTLTNGLPMPPYYQRIGANYSPDVPGGPAGRSDLGVIVSAKPGQKTGIIYPAGHQTNWRALHEALAPVFLRPPTREWLADNFGLERPAVDIAEGSYEGVRESSFQISGKGLTPEAADDLAKAGGLAFAQDAAISTYPVHDLDAPDIIPGIQLDFTTRLSDAEWQAVADALKGIGDFSGTPDGRAARLLYFGDAEGLESWHAAIAGAVSSLPFYRGGIDYFTRSSLFQGADYANFSQSSAGLSGQGRDQAGPAGPSDILGGAYRHLSQPFAQALAREGYGIDIGTYLARHGLGEAERPLIEGAFAPLLERRQRREGSP